MKRFTFLAIFFAMVMSVFAQETQTTMHIWKNGVATNYLVSADIDSITFSQETIDLSMPKVAPTTGAVTIVWNAVGFTPCIDNQLVFAGDYNGYNIDPAALVHFEPIPGYYGWWKAVITPSYADNYPVLAGKPCALAYDGTFPSSWDYQWLNVEAGACEILEGSDEAYLETEYEVESKLYITNNSSVVYVRSYGFKFDPCYIPEYYTVTFTATAPALPEGTTVYVVGGFNGWSTDATPMQYVNGVWTVTIDDVEMGDQYKYVANGTWGNEELTAEPGFDCGYPINNRIVSNAQMRDIIENFSGITAENCYNMPPSTLKGSQVWPIWLDDITAEANASKIVADFRPNDIDRFLYIWMNTYVANDTPTGLNFYGNSEGYISLLVGTLGWCGAGFCPAETENSTAWQAAEDLRQAIVANPDDYYLHMAIKSTDNASHCFYTFGMEATKFVLGSYSVYDGPLYADFARNGEWAEFDIPMSRFAPALATSTCAAGINIFVFLSESIAGAQLNLDAIYFYKKADGENPPVGPVLPEKPDTIGWNIPAECLTVAQAREICAGLESGTSTDQEYYVMGYIKQFHSKHADGVTGYGNALFYMEDVKGANSMDDFLAYQVFGLNGSKITNLDAVSVGDFVVIHGKLTNYNGTYETVGKGAAYVWKSTNPNMVETKDVITYEEGELSVAQALEIGAAMAAGDTTTTIKVRGRVKSIKQVELSSGTASFYITDNGDNELYCYRINAAYNLKFISGDQIKEGDIVTVEARLYNYPSSNGNLLELIKGYLARTTNTFDPSTVGLKVVTVAEAFAIGSELESGSTTPGQYQVTGTVTEVVEASTAYGNMTFYISDGNQEMLCYRIRYFDNRKYTEEDPALEVGDVVTLIAQIKNHNGLVEFVSGYLTEHIK